MGSLGHKIIKFYHRSGSQSYFLVTATRFTSADWYRSNKEYKMLSSSVLSHNKPLRFKQSRETPRPRLVDEQGLPHGVEFAEEILRA